MTTDLEIIDYDLEGAAYDGTGSVVDGAFLLAKVRRRQVVVDGAVTSPQGEVTILRLPIAEMSDKDRRKLFDAFGKLEAIVKGASEAHYAAQVSDPNALDAKISAAAIAKREKRDAEDAKALLEAELLAKRAELAEIEAAVAAWI
jgi:hypothetical protein